MKRNPRVSKLKCSPAAERIRPPPVHYNYDELTDCPCHLCVGVRLLGADAAVKRAMLEADGGRFADVPPEKRYEPLSIAFLAQSNRRDLYCELSYLTSYKAWSAQFLAWVLGLIEDPTWRSEAWWAWRSQTRTLGSWIKAWYDTDPPFRPAP
jgi:hypothetical protein